jgi:ABC-type uncharacterized transport system permease subunit
MGINVVRTLSARVFWGTEPLVVTAISVFAPGIGGEVEIFCQQIGKLIWRLAGEDSLHEIFVIGISFRLMQKNPLTRLRAEDVLAPLVDEDPRSILAWRTGA